MDNYVELPYGDKNIRYEFQEVEPPGLFRVYLPNGTYFRLMKKNGEWRTVADDPAPFHGIDEIGEAIHALLGYR